MWCLQPLPQAAPGPLPQSPLEPAAVPAEELRGQPHQDSQVPAGGHGLPHLPLQVDRLPQPAVRDQAAGGTDQVEINVCRLAVLFSLGPAPRPGRVMVLMCVSVCVSACVSVPPRSLDL